MYAVITAGGRAGAELSRACGSDVKALATLGRMRLIDPVIDAARACEVAGIAVVGPPAVAAYCGERVERLIPSVTSGAENIVRALRSFPQAGRLVFLTSDLPFIDAAGLRDFIARSAQTALTMALAPAGAYEAAFPGAPVHCVTLGGERFANGSAFVIDRTAVAALESVAGRFFAARKSLPRLAALLGPVLCARFVCRRLRISDIEQRAAKILRVSARAIVDAAPGLCYDVDDLADWRYAQARLRPHA